jgi:pentatricopeptide repeat protein
MCPLSKKSIEENPLQLVFGILDARSNSVPRDAIYALLQRCIRAGNLHSARKVHSLVTKNRLDSIPVFVDHLIRLFTACGSLKDARDVFETASHPSIYTWNAIIQAHANLGEGEKALQFFQSMLESNAKPERHTFSSVLKACSSTGCLGLGRFVHDQINRGSIELDHVVGNALVDLYARCGSLKEARKVFDKLLSRSAVSWASLISGYVHQGHGLDAYDLFLKMQIEGVKADKVVFLCVVKSCATMGFIDHGKSIHQQIVSFGLEYDISISNALIDMYAKCGNIQEAKSICDGLQNRDLVTWGALISGYAQHGYGSSALEAFVKMQKEGIAPDELVFSSIIKVCRNLGLISQGRLMYEQLCLFGLESEVVVGSTLVDMYAECGNLDEARWIFDSLPQHDVISWDSMISAWLEHDDVYSALEYLDMMLGKCITPEKATMLCIIKACGDRGALDKVRLMHHQIIRLSMDIEISIGNSIVDAYAKCESLKEALQVFEALVEKTVVSWGALITTYAKRGDSKIALKWFDDCRSQGIKPDDITFLGVLIACSHVGLDNEARLIFESMQKDYRISPNIEHYNCLVDVLGRAGYLEEAEDLLTCVPLGKDIIGWMSLLTGSETYGNMNVGRRCSERITYLDPEGGSGYVLMSSMHSKV